MSSHKLLLKSHVYKKRLFCLTTHITFEKSVNFIYLLFLLKGLELVKNYFPFLRKVPTLSYKQL